jgi:hypothetical protein
MDISVDIEDNFMDKWTFLWKFVDNRGQSWTLVDNCGNLWTFVDICGHMDIFVDNFVDWFMAEPKQKSPKKVAFLYKQTSTTGCPTNR